MVRPAEYVNHTGLSQSDITLFEKNIVQFHEQVILGLQADDRKSDALDRGTVIDAILLDPEALKNNYYVVTQYKATGKEKEVVDIVYSIIMDKMKRDAEDTGKPMGPATKWPELKFFETEILRACDSIAFQPKWKLETRISKIVENGQEYFEQLKEAAGRYTISLEVWNQAHETVNQIGEDESTSKIFQLLKGTHEDQDRYVVHKSEAVYGIDPVTGEPIKGLLDFWLEDLENKVIEPWDLKSCKSHAQFLLNYRMSRYGRQGAFYTILLKLKYKDYRVDPFKFLAIPTQSKEAPEVYQMSESEIIANIDGAESPQGYRVKGFRELIEDTQWHRENGKWAHRKEYYQNGVNIIKGNLNVDPALLVDTDEVIF